MIDGPGKFHKNNGEVVKGHWQHNMLVHLGGEGQ